MNNLESKYIGFDLSTQQLKAIVINDQLEICHHVSVNFELELAEYKAKGGVYRSEEEPNVVTAPVNMWLKALDMCFDKLTIDGLDFGKVACVSGCAQQHGSVWWRRGSGEILSSLKADDYLHTALVSAFSLRESPVWMDSNTSQECKMIEELVGGPEKLTEITGSRAYERFTGPQILKIYRRRREIYNATDRITLISNFLASIFCGSFAPFDASDASGMNMMDITTKKWSQVCLEAVVEGNKAEVSNLRTLLGCKDGLYNENIVDSGCVIGKIASYFVNRYGFSPDCLIAPFVGDNPGSLAGLRVAQDELVISLGTSDTAFFWLEHPNPKINGHILRNPIDPGKYMGLICYKNGSLTRERIRDNCASGSWEEFSRLLNSVPRGNFGNIGFYFDLREIHPLAIGDFRYNKLDQRVQTFSPEIEVRACLEGQFLRLYHHSQNLGLDISKMSKILVTGGASINCDILQVVSDIFQLPIYALDLPNTACLGGAYLAKFAHELNKRNSTAQNMCYKDIISAPMKTDNRIPSKVADPTPIASIDVYKSLMTRYRRLEESIASNNA